MTIEAHYFDALEKILDQQIDKTYQARRARKVKRPWFSISNAGYCQRAAILDRLCAKDVEPSPKTKRIFWIGTQIHEAIVKEVEKSGQLITSEYFVSSGFGENADDEVGAWDFLLRDENGSNILYELKSKNTGAFWSQIIKKKAPIKQHVYQAVRYWTKNKKYRVDQVKVCYFSKEDASMRSFKVEITEDLLAEIEEWWSALKGFYARKELPPPYDKDSDEYKLFYCGTCKFGANYCFGEDEAVMQQNLIELDWEGESFGKSQNRSTEETNVLQKGQESKSS